MCRVLNKHHAGVPVGAVYFGNGSKWRNPFRIGPDGDRAAVIAKYERWLANQRHLQRALDELRGRDLVCFGAPAAYHGDLLLRSSTRRARSASSVAPSGIVMAVIWSIPEASRQAEASLLLPPL